GLDPDYDPRTRPWYVRAMREQGIFFTQPYIFSATQIPGITCAEQLHGQDGVFGADITLDRFSLSLERQKVSDNGMLFLFDREGRIVVHPAGNVVAVQPQGRLSFLPAAESNDPRIRAVVADYQGTPEPVRNRTREIMIDGVGYLVRTAELKDRLKLGQTLASIAPVSDFTSHIRRMRQRIFLFSVMVLLAVLPLALMISRKISWSLTRLEGESVKIRHRDFSASEPFDSRIKEIHSLNLAFDLMKSTIRDYTDRLIQARRDIERLFSAVTELIAGAIDAKSPYTGGHCKRVPEIARLLAAAAHESGQPPFADFHMDTEDQWREFEVAAWLHDCGKLTTPEYVVDKATKLETLYNRIHEIRMRFEVLLRDAEIEACRRRLAGDGDDKVILAELEKAKQQITDDFTFVAACNIGREFMTDDQIQRLEEIAARTWTRYLNDRVGISEDEMLLKSKTSAPTLPVVEPVLADKPEHIIPRTDPKPFGETSHAFTMPIPEHQYNLGERYNLTIRKGTLSPEERFKINEHIIQTILMLEQLPFPDNMKQVPDIAGSHHETMDGTG
ncbi:MAG TPA: HD domain-containing phosphohydrolase, partial [Desulfosarcina sp.]|nr:HD domain-containing phosphohydrolase [Desulfosarcina sp.]